MLLSSNKIIVYLIFMISGMVCYSLIFNSYRKKESRREKAVKIILMVYFGMNILLGIFLTLRDIKIIPSDIKSYPLIILYIQLLEVVAFHFIYIVTNKDQKLFIPVIHYIFPVLMFIIIWFFFTLLHYKTPSSGEMNRYMRPYTAFSFIFYLLFYTSLSFKYINQYHKSIKNNVTERPKKGMYWLSGIIASKIFSFLMILIVAFTSPKTGDIFYLLNFTSSSLHFCFIVYHILERNYQFLVPASNNAILAPTGHIIHGYKQDIEQVTIINKKAFEDYFRDHKPYLNPDLKITDIASAFSTNRSYLSKFINEIYGMSFSQYINNWRVHEVKQLSSLDENSSESIEEISRMAGFGSVRSYWRAVKNNP